METIAHASARLMRKYNATSLMNAHDIILRRLQHGDPDIQLRMDLVDVNALIQNAH